MTSSIVLKLNMKETKAIEEFMTTSKSVRERKRAQAVLYTARGLSSIQIAQFLGVHLRTVQRCIARYRKRGVTGFRDRSRSGRKPKLSEETKEKLLKATQESPRLFGFLNDGWSLSLLKLYLKKETGVEISTSHIWRLLRKHGITYKKAETRSFGHRKNDTTKFR